ncbi:MAG TPA: cupin domain-containing protein [Rhodanobacteraceae bacterium]|nr:cupin domain-containing protein [Rhodanobacteraceae bacterium]
MSKARSTTPPIEVNADARHPLGMLPARFLRDYWQKRPLLIRGAFPGFQPPLSPDDLAGLACMDGVLARIVTRMDTSGSSRTSRNGGPGSRDLGKAKALDYSPRQRLALRAVGSVDVRSGILPARSPFRGNDGNWRVASGPFDDATFAQLPETNWTLLVQDVDKWDADTASLLDAFAFVPSWRIDDVMVSYASDGGGVGAHVDQYDVFLLQGLGQRHWSIDTRPNPSTAFRDDVELKLLREFHPTREWTLEPGDMLYLPPGVPHDGAAVGECMTFSVGMRAPAASELLLDFSENLAATLPESQRYADPDLAPATAAGEIDAAALERARRALGPIAAMLDNDAFADWFGCFITRYRSAQAPMPRRRPIDRAALARRLSQSTFRRDPWCRFAWRRTGRDARFYSAGMVLDAPIAWARTMASGARTFDGANLAELPHPTRGIALLSELINAGHVTYRRR